MKILIAYDGSECADAALDDLRRAGLPSPAEALVVSVAEVWLPPPPPSSYELVGVEQGAGEPADGVSAAPAIEEANGLALRAAERLRGDFPGWAVRAEALSGSPAWEVVKKADEWRPDLVVVGSQGRSALGRFVLGSVSQKVVTEARCSVRVARGKAEAGSPPVRIVVGVDGWPASMKAVGAVAGRAWPQGSEARVVAVHDPLKPSLVGRLIPPVRKWVGDENALEESWIEKAVGKAAEELRATGLDASPLVLEGEPKRALVEAAREWDADSIFVGATRYDSRARMFLLGSVSAAVAARAHCSVEVVCTAQTELSRPTGAGGK